MTSLVPCPPGFAIPEDPTNSGNILIPGSPCAMMCPRPILTDGEEDNLVDIGKYLSCITLCTSFLIALAWNMLPSKRNLIFIRFMLGMSFISALLIFLAWYLPVHKKGLHDVVCENDTVPANVKDDGYGACEFQSLGIPYVGLVLTTTWMLVAMNYFFRVCRNSTVMERNFKKIFVATFIVPFIVYAIPAMSMKELGYQGASGICLVPSDDKAYNYGTLQAWNIILVSLGFIFTTAALFGKLLHRKRASTAAAEEGNPPPSHISWRMILFLYTFTLPPLILFGFHVSSDRKDSEHNDSLAFWTGCMFKVFYGAGFNSDLALATCGNVPSDRVSVNALKLVTIAVTGQGLWFILPFAFRRDIYSEMWACLRGRKVSTSPEKEKAKEVEMERGNPEATAVGASPVAQQHAPISGVNSAQVAPNS